MQRGLPLFNGAMTLMTPQQPPWEIIIRPARKPGSTKVYVLDHRDGNPRNAAWTDGAYTVQIDAESTSGLLTAMREYELLTWKMSPDIYEKAQVTLPLPSGKTWAGSLLEFLARVEQITHTRSESLIQDALEQEASVSHSIK